MRHNGLSSEEICSILLTCRDANVSVLKFGDLLVRFGKQTKRDHSYYELDAELSPSSDTAISETQQQQAKESLIIDEIDLRNEQLAQMILEDPVEAEKLLMSGKLDEGFNGEEA